MNRMMRAVREFEWKFDGYMLGAIGWIIMVLGTLISVYKFIFSGITPERLVFLAGSSITLGCLFLLASWFLVGDEK